MMVITPPHEADGFLPTWLPDNAKYHVMYGGDWRPVVAMHDSQQKETLEPRSAAAVTFWVSEHGGYCTESASHVGMIFERDRPFSGFKWTD